MRRGGIINPALAGALARLGHTDLLVVCDAGLPIPHGPAAPDVVDLSFRFGVPAFETVLSGLLEELEIEGATAAEEARSRNPATYDFLSSHFPNLGFVPHEGLKRIVSGAKLVVRTGEATPFSNVVLRCGVPF